MQPQSRSGLVATAAAGVWALGASGCSHLGYAIDVASSAWSCPKDQIKVISVSGEDRDPPRPDVAADERQLAIWQKQGDPDARNYVLSGCGETATVSCHYVDTKKYILWGCDVPSSHRGLAEDGKK
jgi:hypothetical protein